MDSTIETTSTHSGALRGDISNNRTKDKGEYRLFKIFEPTPERITAVAKHLMENKYSMSDEYRDYDIIHGILHKYLLSNNCIFYMIGDMDGVLGFTDIIPGWKAHAIFELFNPKIWGKQLVRESRKLFDSIMDEGKLVKISSQTADIRVKRMAEMIGFTLEGLRVAEFSWDKELYNIFLLGRLRTNGDIEKEV